MHPVYRNRCQRDGLEVETMWLDRDDLEPDPGGSLAMEQPTRIVTRPLNRNSSDDRVRAIFNLTSDDPWPEVETERLDHYHHYLTKTLSFPFAGCYEEEVDSEQVVKHPVMVAALFPAEADDEYDGLRCDVLRDGEHQIIPLAAVIAVQADHQQLIADYCHWLAADPGGGPVRLVASRTSELGVGRGDLARALFAVSWIGALSGATAGAALSALDAASAVEIGAALLGVIGLGLGVRLGRLHGVENQVRPTLWLYGLIGGGFGSFLGGLMGAMFCALGGVAGGGLAGFLFAKFFRHKRQRPGFGLVAVLVVAQLGAIVQAWIHDGSAAWSGGWIGALAGAILGPIIVVASVNTLMLLEKDAQ